MNKTTVTYISQAISLLTSCDLTTPIWNEAMTKALFRLPGEQQTTNSVRERETEKREVKSKRLFNDRRLC